MCIHRYKSYNFRFKGDDFLIYCCDITATKYTMFQCDRDRKVNKKVNWIFLTCLASLITQSNGYKIMSSRRNRLAIISTSGALCISGLAAAISEYLVPV